MALHLSQIHPEVIWQVLWLFLRSLIRFLINFYRSRITSPSAKWVPPPLSLDCRIFGQETLPFSTGAAWPPTTLPDLRAIVRFVSQSEVLHLIFSSSGIIFHCLSDTTHSSSSSCTTTHSARQTPFLRTSCHSSSRGVGLVG